MKLKNIINKNTYLDGGNKKWKRREELKECQWMQH
jgi:hypothetical protein